MWSWVLPFFVYCRTLKMTDGRVICARSTDRVVGCSVTWKKEMVSGAINEVGAPVNGINCPWQVLTPQNGHLKSGTWTRRHPLTDKTLAERAPHPSQKNPTLHPPTIKLSDRA